MSEVVFDYRANPGALGASIAALYVNMSGELCVVHNDGIEEVVPTALGALAIAAGKTVTFNKTMTLTAADDTGSYTLPTGTKTLLATDGDGAGLSNVDAVTLLGNTWASPEAIGSGTPQDGTFTNLSASAMTTTAGRKMAYVGITSNYSVAANQVDIIEVTANSVTVTLPTANSVAGRRYTIKNSGAGVASIVCTGGEVIDGETQYLLSVPYEAITVASDGSNWKVIWAYKISPNPHAMFSDDTATQTVANTSVGQVITFNRTEDSSGVTLANSSQIVCPSHGDYLVSYSAVCTKTGGGTGTLDIWVRKNGTTNITRSNTRTTVNSGTDVISSAAFIFDTTTPADYFELMMCGSATTVGIVSVAESVANPVRPGCPSIIVSIVKVSR